MSDYKAMYNKAFNALTDAEDLIQRAGMLLIRANAVIIATQQQCEEMYISAKEKEKEAKEEEKEPDV